MKKKAWRWGLTTLGAGIGIGVPTLVFNLLQMLYLYDAYAHWQEWVLLIIYAVCMATGAVLAHSFAYKLMVRTKIWMRFAERKSADLPLPDFVVRLIGVTIGLLLSYLLSGLYRDIPSLVLRMSVGALTYAVLATLGMRLAVRRIEEFDRFSWYRNMKTNAAAPAHASQGGVVVDTSALIDGRIIDIYRAGFLPGPLVVHTSVLEEIQHVADAMDPTKRAKGRRGLELLERLREAASGDWSTDETAFKPGLAVDMQLVKLAQKRRARLMTCDYNLHKVAQLSDVAVLNVNELATAMRLVLTHGAELSLQIVKEGNQPGQGVGYMPDGTMIVVDNARTRIGETVDISVTSVLQTAAGRMIFARIREEE